MADQIDPDVLLDDAIVFEVEGGDRVHSPMVHARVGGVATRLILDTGSTDHVLTKPVVDRAGAATTPAEDGTDHAGAAVASWSVGDLPVSIGPATFDLHDVVAIASPGPFDAWGVGGFLSPQHLHPTARVLIDLVGDRLVVVDTAGRDRASIDDRLTARIPGHRRLDLARVKGEETVAVDAAVDGFEPVRAMLNTGGRGTEFARAAATSLARAEPRAGSHGISGAPVMGADAGARDLIVGGVRAPVSRLVIRDEIEEVGGIIGMDILRGTALICGADPDGPVIWLVPSTWPAA